MADTLHLNLKRKWFDMILSGEKTEEYRELKKYWEERFWHLFPQTIRGETYSPIVETITFSNGYAKNRPQFVIEFKGISIKQGKTKWGAEDGVDYFVLELGDIVKINKYPVKLINCQVCNVEYDEHTPFNYSGTCANCVD